MAVPAGDLLSERSKRYSSFKYSLSILETVYLIAVLFVFTASGASRVLAGWITELTPMPGILVRGSYLFIVSLCYYLLTLPLSFFGSYILEHKFSLSNQSIPDWFIDQLKSGILSYIIGLILLGAFYYILKHNPQTWWLVISFFWIFFSLILTRLTPVLIIPLFFKYKKLSEETLRERIMRLAERMQVKILDVFEIDFSKKTLKANAAFVGMGATRRIILADTLKDKYSHDEIEVILAHEFAHYKLKHIFKLVLINSLAVLVSFYLIFRTSSYALGMFGFSSLSDIAALPVIIIYFVLFGIIMQPLGNYLSRRLETQADVMALEVTGLKEAFISMMEKLSSQNLADRNPHPLIRFFFFDHPPVDERINRAKSS